MSLWSFAARWLRERRVALLAMTISALGVTAMIPVVALMDGVQRFLVSHLRGREADLIAIPFVRIGPDGVLALAERDFTSELTAAGGPIVAFAPRLEEDALIWAKDSALTPLAEEIEGARLLGIDLARERQVSSLEEASRAVEDGGLRLNRPFEDDLLAKDKDGIPGIFLGDNLARKLGLKANRAGGRADLVRVSVPRADVDMQGLGDPETLTTERMSRYVATQTFRVIGALDSRREEFDAVHAWVDRQVLREMIYGRPGVGLDARTVHLKLAQPEDADEVAEALRLRYGNWRFETAVDQADGEFGAIEDQKRIFIIILSFITIAGSAGIFGMVFTMVREKTRDIGILRSMGLSRRRMVLAFTLYGALLGIIGAALGLGLGLIVADRLDALVGFASRQLGVPLLNPEVYPFERVPTYVDPRAVATILLANIATTFFASLLPALRAGRLRPVEALRSD